jgi:hypothetical protein
MNWRTRSIWGIVISSCTGQRLNTFTLILLSHSSTEAVESRLLTLSASVGTGDVLPWDDGLPWGVGAVAPFGDVAAVTSSSMVSELLFSLAMTVLMFVLALITSL